MIKMKRSCSFSFHTLVLTLLFASCLSFSTTRFHPAKLHENSARIHSRSPDLFGSPLSQPNRRLFMTSEESKEEEKAASTPAEVGDEVDEDGSEEKRSLAKTILLTVPLFCKFVVVLLIKFVTDLVVFPLLFLYRLAGVAKRKVFKLFGSGDKFGKVNGEK